MHFIHDQLKAKYVINIAMDRNALDHHQLVSVDPWLLAGAIASGFPVNQVKNIEYSCSHPRIDHETLASISLSYSL